MLKLLGLLLFPFFNGFGSGIPKPWQIGFQEARSPLMAVINDVHNLLVYIIFTIALVVVLLLGYAIYKFRASKNPVPATFTHHTALEITWTVIPVLILVIILIPSMKILYVFDKIENPDMTIKVIGHQWYWSYEYPHDEAAKTISFDSYMIPTKDLKPGQLRLLDVDKPLVIPQGKTVRVLVTSQDVIHSFAVPSFGIKIDSIPGRTNETWMRVDRPGMYYGQCSELCGKDHGFMPIAVKVVPQTEYDAWYKSQTEPATPDTENTTDSKENKNG